MKKFAATKNACESGPCAGRCPEVPCDRQASQREYGQARDHACDAVIFVMSRFSGLVDGEDRREAEKAGDQHGGCVERLGEGREDAAEQSGNRICANAGGAASVGSVAFPPAAFDPNQKAYSQG